jgi:hypothetical protein
MAKKKIKKVEHFEYISWTHKPTSTYVMSKRTKRMLALMPFRDAEDRNTFKRQMIQAELAERDAKNKPLSMNKKESSDVSERT